MDSKRDSERQSESERRKRETETDVDGASSRETEVELAKREGRRQTPGKMEVSYRPLKGSPIQMFLTHICITLLLEDIVCSYW